MAESAFIVHVPEAQTCVGGLRERFDASVKVGVPAHITVLVPFMDPGLITDEVIRQAQRALHAVPAFSFSLSAVARFPTTTYLVPEPSGPFIALTRSLVSQFPEYPPFRGEHDTIVPHLTVAHGDADKAGIAARELEMVMHAHGPICSMCSHITLLENSSGQWTPMHSFGLSR